jgi:hypothetical protein
MAEEGNIEERGMKGENGKRKERENGKQKKREIEKKSDRNGPSGRRREQDGEGRSENEQEIDGGS